MKREILFRGKSMTNNKWYEGQLVSTNERNVVFLITGTPIVFDYTGDEDDDLSFYKWQQVYPESVGQFTGLTDKNGNKIFEGDVVAPWIFRNHKNYKLEVVSDHGGFGLKAKKPFLPQFKYLHLFANKCKTAHTEIVVIGNIYDNPELS